VKDSSAPTHFAKDFLSILDLSNVELEELLRVSAQMKADRRLGRQAPFASVLAGLHVALLFEKPSLRTRSTFEIAVRELGEGKREPIQDIARNLERWVRALVIRTFAQKKAAILAAAGPNLHVINALTDEEHPCQALADAFTMRERWGDCRGRRIAFVGDGNNVATSLAHVACMLGVTFHIASPTGYELPDKVVDDLARFAGYGATISRFSDPRRAVAGVDAVYTDVWASMGEEEEAAERRRIFAPYQVTADLMAAADRNAIFMHCLPAHRGEEVASEVIDSPASVVFDQAENRLHTQKALLSLLIG
jgi:ornithine carbamoyltransferase